MSIELVTIKNEALTVTVSTLGAEMQSITGKGKTEFLWNGDPSVWGRRAPLMFPICGRLKDNKYTMNGVEYSLSKHGFVRDSNFCVESLEESAVTMVFRANEETKKVYPFDFVFRVKYEVSGNKLTVSIIVENEGKDTMYFSTGSHEAYACPEGIEAYSVVFEKTENLMHTVLNGPLLTHETVCVMENTNELPLKKSYFAEDALVFTDLTSRRVTLTKRNSSKKVTLEFAGNDYLLIWTKPEGNYIALEPWCGIPDREGAGYDITQKEGIRALKAGETSVISHAMTFEE